MFNFAISKVQGRAGRNLAVSKARGRGGRNFVISAMGVDEQKVVCYTRWSFGKVIWRAPMHPKHNRNVKKWKILRAFGGSCSVPRLLNQLLEEAKNE